MDSTVVSIASGNQIPTDEAPKAGTAFLYATKKFKVKHLLSGTTEFFGKSSFPFMFTKG